MAPELSSNWKRLQSTLKQEKTTKKKQLTERQQNTIAKRKRLEGKSQIVGKSLASTLQTTKRRKMGGSNSTATESPEEQDDNAPSASLALWAEDNDISPADLAAAYGTSLKSTTLPSTNPQDLINIGLSPEVEIGKFIAIDCEMVGVGSAGSESSVLARVSLVNFHGTQVYDSFVRPKEFVTDWRTHVSGISPSSMTNARTFEQVQGDVASLIKNRILIGHAIRNDLDVLMMGHPKRDIRDTSKFKGFRKFSAGRSPALKKLAKEILGVDIQGGQHSSVEDARATMLLFRRFKGEFEVEHAQRFPQRVVGEGSSKGGKKKKKGKK